MMIELVFTSLFVGLTSAVTDINAEARATRKKVKVFILAGQSNMEGHGQIQSLDHLGNHPQYGHLLKKLKALDSSWAVSNNVFVSWQTYGQPRRHAPLSVGQGATENSVGPELMFGTIMGEEYDMPILLIKTAWGGKDVYCDFRSPGAGDPDGDAERRLEKERSEGQGREVGVYYRLMVSEIFNTLEKIGEIVPSYQGQGYELAGLVWFQGWNDFCQWPEFPGIISDYPRHLSTMIHDLRQDLNVPEMPFVIGELGIGGEEMVEKAKGENNHEARAIVHFRQGQRTVASESGLEKVTFVPTADFWDNRLQELRQISDRWWNEKRKKGIPDSEENHLPTKELNDEYLQRGNHWYCHYNGSASNYCLIGYALAQALINGE